MGLIGLSAWPPEGHIISHGANAVSIPAAALPQLSLDLMLLLLLRLPLLLVLPLLLLTELKLGTLTGYSRTSGGGALKRGLTGRAKPGGAALKAENAEAIR